MKVAVAEQPIQALDAVAGGAHPGQVSPERGEGQALAVEEGLDGEEQGVQAPAVDERAGAGEPALK